MQLSLPQSLPAHSKIWSWPAWHWQLICAGVTAPEPRPCRAFAIYYDAALRLPPLTPELTLSSSHQSDSREHPPSSPCVHVYMHATASFSEQVEVRVAFAESRS